jgi:hypothetical protein
VSKLASLATLAISLGACGADGEEPARCLPKSTQVLTCVGDLLHACPPGEGLAWVEMVLVEDCAASGEVCHDPLTSDPSCKDPARKHNIVGPDAARYAEQDEQGNDARQSAEDTGYALDEKGLVVSGALVADDVDHYVFRTSALTRFDLQALFGSEKAAVSIAIDAVADDGYSVLQGSGYFINATLPNASAAYVLWIRGVEAKPYTIEIKGNAP